MIWGLSWQQIYFFELKILDKKYFILLLFSELLPSFGIDMFNYFKLNLYKKTYAVVFIDAIHFKVREKEFSKEVLGYISMEINLEGKKRF